MPRLYQGSFSAGEVSPAMWGRVDSERFQSGVRVGRNVFFRPEGGVVKRPGLEWVGFGLETLTAEAKLVPFKFNNEQTYVVVMQRDNCYFVKDGGVVLEDMDAFGGVGTPTVGNDASGVYVDYTTHGYVAGQRIFWNEGGYDQLEGRWAKVATSPAPTANRFYLVDYITGTNLDGSTYDTNARTIDFGKIYSLATSDGYFTDVNPEELDWTQANDKLYVANEQEETKIFTRGATDTSWTITDFDPNPAVSAPSIAEGTYPTSFNKPAGVETIDYAVTAIDNDTFEESLASLLTISSIDPATMAPPVTTGSGAEIDVTHQSGADTYRVYKSTGGIYGLIGQVQGTSGTLTFQDYGITPNLTFAPPLEVNPEFNTTDEYPGAVELFQQRILFGRTNDKLRDVYMSRSGSFSSFASSTVNTDDDPVVQQIAARSVHEVRYFIPLKDLVVLTTDGAWGFDKGDVGVITPDSGLVAQSFWGAARVKPALIGDSAIYVGESGSTVRDLAYSLQEDGFASSDLTLLAKHLFAGRTVVSMTFAEVPYNVLFCVMSDGSALSCTYVRDQQIFAWARHNTNGRFLDCTSIRENGRDNIYCFVERTADDSISPNLRFNQIERMVTKDPQYIDQGLYLDNSIDQRQGNDWDVDGLPVIYPRIEANALEIQIDDGIADDAIIRIRDTEGTILEAMNGLSVMVDASSANQTGTIMNYDAYQVFRHDSGEDKTAFRYEDILPEDFVQPDTIGYADLETTRVRRAHHLYWRGPNITVRGDHTFSDDQTVNGNGVLTLPNSQSAALIHVGEPYIAEIETLDIDDNNDPVTGLPLQIGNMLLRFELCRTFATGRTRSSTDLYTRSDLSEEEDFDIQIGGLQGIVDQLQHPAWNRRGRMIVRSRDPFPWKLSAVIPQVEAGDVDV